MDIQHQTGERPTALWSALMAYLSHRRIAVDGSRRADDNASAASPRSRQALAVSRDIELKLGVVRRWGNFR
jgi:hypothetical protein